MQGTIRLSSQHLGRGEIVDGEPEITHHHNSTQDAVDTVWNWLRHILPTCIQKGASKKAYGATFITVLDLAAWLVLLHKCSSKTFLFSGMNAFVIHILERIIEFIAESICQLSTVFSFWNLASRSLTIDQSLMLYLSRKWVLFINESEDVFYSVWDLLELESLPQM